MSNRFRVTNLEDTNGHSTRWYSSRQEKAVAKATNGRTTANSGATLFSKGDVIISNSILLECKTKTTNAESISVKKEWFDKNRKEIIATGKDYSVVVINFGPDAPYNENHYIIDEDLFQELLDYLKEKEN